jgi:hypothetical protein
MTPKMLYDIYIISIDARTNTVYSKEVVSGITMTTKLITITATPNPTLELIQTLEKFIRWNDHTAKYYIAGGAVRKAFMGQAIGASDIDLFFPDFNEYMKVLRILNKVYEGSRHPNCRQFFFNASEASPFTQEQIDAAEPTSFSGEGLRRIPIQMIDSSYYDTPEQVVDSFDFTICQMLYHKGQYFISEQGYSDHQQGILDFASDLYDINRFKHQRLIKYCKYGYTPTMGLYAKVFLSPDAIHSGDFNANDPNAEYDI